MINRQRCYKIFDKLKFKADLVKVNWDGFCLTSNLNDALAHILKIVNELLDKHAPYKTIKYSKPQYETKPWIPPGLANSIRNKNKLYKSFCKEKDPKINPINLRNQLRKSIQIILKSYIFVT